MTGERHFLSMAASSKRRECCLTDPFVVKLSWPGIEHGRHVAVDQRIRLRARQVADRRDVVGMDEEPINQVEDEQGCSDAVCHYGFTDDADLQGHKGQIGHFHADGPATTTTMMWQWPRQSSVGIERDLCIGRTGGWTWRPGSMQRQPSYQPCWSSSRGCGPPESERKRREREIGSARYGPVLDRNNVEPCKGRLDFASVRLDESMVSSSGARLRERQSEHEGVAETSPSRLRRRKPGFGTPTL